MYVLYMHMNTCIFMYMDSMELQGHYGRKFNVVLVQPSPLMDTNTASRKGQ